jgi:hypothetical protein
MVSKKLGIIAVEIRFDHDAKHPKNPLGSKSSRRGVNPINAMDSKIPHLHSLREGVVLCKSLRRIISSGFPISLGLP